MAGAHAPEPSGEPPARVIRVGSRALQALAARIVKNPRSEPRYGVSRNRLDPPSTAPRSAPRPRSGLGFSSSWGQRAGAPGIEREVGAAYRGGMEGSEERARKAARTDGLLLRSYGSRPVEWDRIKYSMLEERLEQVREIDGELAYEKMRRAVEKASQEKARQVERARLERARQETARQSRERRGPERRGPERDFGPSR